eukprot:scaffold1493_cov172-Ochromonas_danica.AAC.11
MGPKALVDPDGRLAAFLLYANMIKILPIDGLSFRESFNLTMQESRLIDIKFLYGCFRPTFCLLYEDNHRYRHVKTLSVDMREKELVAGPWSQNNVDYSASFLIPVPSPLNGVIVLGLTSFTYLSGTGVIQAVEVSPAQICSYCLLDPQGTRFLLCDHRGLLTVLSLVVDNGKVVSIVTDTLGTTSIANSMSYLDHGLVFIGSALGDSQLVKLHSGEGGVEVLDVYKNTGPILDMCLVETDRIGGGQLQLVTCSGAYKDGSLRLIRNGIGIHEQASMEVSGIRAVFSLRDSEVAEYDKYLVQSFISETRILAIEGEELAEIEIPGFDAENPTIYCANLIGKVWVQVTTQGIRLVDSTTLTLLHNYTFSKTITVAKGNSSQLIISLSGGGLIYMEMDVAKRELVTIQETQLDQDVACLSLKPTPLFQINGNRNGDAMDIEDEKQSIVAVGMWTDNSVRLLALPSFQEIRRVTLGTDTQARDLALASWDGVDYVFVGMGDGHLVTFTIQTDREDPALLPTLTNRRNGVIGTQPIAFQSFYNNQELCIFACCDRPTVLCMRNGKIFLSVVDLPSKGVTSMTPFHAELFPDCITLCSDNSVTIGVIEDIQKLHVQTLPLHEAPRRIAHCPAQHVYAVCTELIVQGDQGEESISRVLFYDDIDMSLIASYKLDLLEQALSVLAVSFDNSNNTNTTNPQAEGDNNNNEGGNRSDGSSYIVVGTAQIVAEDIEPSKGRVLVFQLAADRKTVQLITEKETKSGVYALSSVCGRLAACIGTKIQIYKFVTKEHNSIKAELQAECSHQGHIMALHLKTQGEYLIVGDLARSITILQYKSNESVLEEIARDYNVHLMRAVEVMEGEESYYLGCEDSCNLFTLRRRAEATSEEDRSKLEERGLFHLGDYVNVMRRGTLVSTTLESDFVGNSSTGASSSSNGGILGSIFDTHYRWATGLNPQNHCVLYGTVSGAIGCFLGLSEPSYQFFSAVEKAMRTIINPIGGFSHQDWRNFRSESRMQPQKYILDGDLIEMILDLDSADLEIVVKEVNNTLATLSVGEAAEGGLNSSESIASLIGGLAAERKVFSSEDIVRRVEDISRLH